MASHPRRRAAGLTALAALFALWAILATASAEDAPRPRSFDVGAWALSLDLDRPAGGDYVRYEGGAAIEDDLHALLRTRLFAGDPRLAAVAVEELGARGVPDGEAVLLEFARSERWSAVDSQLRIAVLRALRLMRSGRALPLLGRVAVREDGAVARQAIRALCESVAPEAVPVLRALALQGDRRQRKSVIKWLRKTGEREAARAVRRERRGRLKEERRQRRDEREQAR